jgi:hypothetical protein
MGRLTKRKWIQQLDKLRNIYSKEGHLRDKGQAAITEHFTIVQSERPRRQKIAQQRITRKKGRQLTLNVTSYKDCPEEKEEYKRATHSE